MIDDRVFLEILETIKKQSTCSFYKTGALIVKDNRIVSIGYNGTPSGFPQCNELNEFLEWVLKNRDDREKVESLLDCVLENNCSHDLLAEKFVLFEKYPLAEYRPLRERIKETALKMLEELEEGKEVDLYRYNFIHSRYEIHAEQNAIAYSVKAGTNINGSTIYSALLPCMECAKLIVASGIKRVVYTEDYTDKRFNESSVDFLRMNGVDVVKLNLVRL